MRRLRVAIIGCGRISVCYAEAFRRLSDKMQLVIAVDKVTDKAKKFAEPFGAEYSNRIEDIYSRGIDVVHLCLPHDLHAPVAIDMMEHGIHVLTEKPMALTLQDADRMIGTAERTGRKLGCIFQTRFNESVQQLRNMYHGGVFGSMNSARSYLSWNRPESYYSGSDWKGTWAHEGGGTLIDQAIHSIDRVRYIVGSDVEWIEGSIHNHCHPARMVEDAAEAAIKFKNGVIYNLYSCNYYGFDSPINIEFCCEKGRFGLKQDVGYSWVGTDYREYRYVTGDQVVGKDYWGTTHYMQLEDFYDSILEDRPTLVDGLEGKKTLEMIKGIYLSALQHKKIYLPFTDERITDEMVRSYYEG